MSTRYLIIRVELDEAIVAVACSMDYSDAVEILKEKRQEDDSVWFYIMEVKEP